MFPPLLKERGNNFLLYYLCCLQHLITYRRAVARRQNFSLLRRPWVLVQPLRQYGNLTSSYKTIRLRFNLSIGNLIVSRTRKGDIKDVNAVFNIVRSFKTRIAAIRLFEVNYYLTRIYVSYQFVTTRGIDVSAPAFIVEYYDTVFRQFHRQPRSLIISRKRVVNAADYFRLCKRFFS